MTEKYLSPKVFANLFSTWTDQGKPKGNDPLWTEIWNNAINASKACIGKLQRKYSCKYSNYDDKMLDTAALVVRKLLTMTEPPDNLVNLTYLYALGVCCGSKSKKQDQEDQCSSYEETFDFYE